MLGCRALKSFRIGNNALESARDLSSSGDFDFFQRLYPDENPGSPCYRNQWSERFRVR